MFSAFMFIGIGMAHAIWNWDDIVKSSRQNVNYVYVFLFIRQCKYRKVVMAIFSKVPFQYLIPGELVLSRVGKIGVFAKVTLWNK